MWLLPRRNRDSYLQEEKMEISFIGMALIVGLGLIWFWNSLYIIKEWERGVVLRLGRLIPEAKSAGINLVFWPIETLYRINMRIETLDVPPQDIITRDNVSVKVNAVCYFRVVDANLALSQVQNYTYATSQLAQTTIRSVVGQFELDEILSQRDKVNAKLQVILDTDTDRKSTRLNSSHLGISYAVFCLKKKIIYTPHFSGDAPHLAVMSALVARDASFDGALHRDTGLIQAEYTRDFVPTGGTIATSLTV